MPNLVVRTYALSADEMGGDGLLPYLNADGAVIGAGASLLEKDGAGRWKARSRPALEALLSVGYGAPIDMAGRMGGLEAVARALNAGDRTRAAIALVHTRLPPLASVDHARRMVEADRFGALGLVKYDPSEPRVPAGDPAGGQWTGGSAAQAHNKKRQHWHGKYTPVPGIPENARLVRYPDGSVVSDPKSGTKLLAPSEADFRHIYAAGENIEGEPLSEQYETAKDAIAHEGEFDFQRDPLTGRFFPSYINASNYAVGVYMAGAGHSWAFTWSAIETYARLNSINYGSAAQIFWAKRGWTDAVDGKWK